MVCGIFCKDGEELVQDELLLLNRARALDADALSEIHDTYYALIYRYLAFRTNDHQTAEDLTSEVFVRLLGALRDKSAPQNTLRGWLFGVAARVLKEHYRQQKRFSSSEVDEQWPEERMEPEQALMKEELQAHLHHALTDLTSDQQAVLALRYGSALPIREVANLLGKTEGAIKVLQARAVAALSRKLGRGEGHRGEEHR